MNIEIDKQTRTRIRCIWSGMKQRCHNPKKSNYKYYGGRGIKICKEWDGGKQELNNFIQWSLANGYKDKLQIDRIDTNGNYEPSNCRWVTCKENNQNKRLWGPKYVYKGQLLTQTQITKLIGVHPDSLNHRLKRHNIKVGDCVDDEVDKLLSHKKTKISK